MEVAGFHDHIVVSDDLHFLQLEPIARIEHERVGPAQETQFRVGVVGCIRSQDGAGQGIDAYAGKLVGEDRRRSRGRH